MKADYYVGEFVLTDKIIYLVTMSGAIREIANRLDPHLKIDAVWF